VKLDDFGFGFSWAAGARTCHALGHDGRVWLIDPVDVPEAVDRARELGEIQSVLQLLDRHNRDCAALAQRLGVPHVRLPQALPDVPFALMRVVWRPGWREIGMWWPQERALVVAEAIGTLPFFTAGRGRAGVHALLRLLPPSALRGYEPEHLLVGHGKGVHGPQAATALEDALDRSRSDIPRVLTRLPALLRG
jgi:hypothetical protein